MHMTHNAVPAATPAVDAILQQSAPYCITTRMLGLMQDWPLVLTKILHYAAKSQGEQEVVTCTAEGPVYRYTYADMHIRSQSCALALQRLGVRYVEARRCSLLCKCRRYISTEPRREGSIVATLAFNTYRHMESW